MRMNNMREFIGKLFYFILLLSPKTADWKFNLFNSTFFFKKKKRIKYLNSFSGSENQP